MPRHVRGRLLDQHGLPQPPGQLRGHGQQRPRGGPAVGFAFRLGDEAEDPVLLGYVRGGGGACVWGGGWLGQPTPSLPGARATPAQPASGGGCLPQPRWAVCATGVGAHQGQTSREGERGIWWTARTAHGGRHLGRTETQRGRRWTACRQRCVDSKNSQTTPATTSTSPNTPTIGRR